MAQERRLNRRFTIESDGVRVSVLPSRKIHSIRDISKGGLSIEYFPAAEEEPFESEAIDIIALDCDRFYLSKITCNTVYDIATLMKGRFFSGAKMRTRGVKFVELTKEQEENLDILLTRCLDASS